MKTKMLYLVAADGTIVSAEGQLSEEGAIPDPVFAPSFQCPEMIGRNLFSFIAGREVRHFYALLHERVLRDACGIKFDYRCDSPEIRRDMNMSLTFDNNLVRYESIVLKESPMPESIPLPSPGAETLIPICSICKRYRYPANSADWKEVEMILKEPGIPQSFDFTHTFCTDCYERVMEEFSCNMATAQE